MLETLLIHNIALVENLTIDFHPGMNVLSGETGAGKSIIVDSINLVLGERADRGLIRSGCEKASVEAQIDVSGLPKVASFLREQEIAEEDHLILFREITASGRNTCRLNGVVVPLTTLRALTEMLVDVHGQHEHQRLLNSKNHLSFLDAFGDKDFVKLKKKTEDAYLDWKAASGRFSALRKENARRIERTEYLTSRVKELDELSLEMGEASRLAEEKKHFAGAEQINAALQSAVEHLSAGKKERTVPEKLKETVASLESIANMEPKAAALAQKLKNLFYELEEAGIEVRELSDEQNFDPERYEEVSVRLDQIRRLERRYGMEADEIVRSHAEMKEELSRLSSSEERLKAAETEFKNKLHTYRGFAAALSEKRHILASMMEKSMEKQLAELGMEKTVFSCRFETAKDSQRVMPTAEGDDTVEFFIAPNPGEPLKPLSATASGGELSRLMLAFKASAAEHDEIPTMIFDEIDTGISGRIASSVAEKMADISRYHQVLCVTHLAQIAGMADREFLVRKSVSGDRTYTEASPLEGEERVAEIARLIGVTEASQQSGFAHAREILSVCGDYRAGHGLSK